MLTSCPCMAAQKNTFSGSSGFRLAPSISGFMSSWAGLAGDFRSPEDSDLVALMHTSAGWMFGLCAVCLGIIQLRNMYSGKISRAWELPVWIGTIVGLIGLLSHIAGL